MEQMMEFMRGLDWSHSAVSLKTGVVDYHSFFLEEFYAARDRLRQKQVRNKSGDGRDSDPSDGTSSQLPDFSCFWSSVCGVRLVLRCVKFWNQGGTDLASLYSGGNGSCFSTDVQDATAFEQVDANLYMQQERLVCREKDFLKVVIPSAGPGILFRNDSDIWPGLWVSMGQLPCWQEISWKDRDDLQKIAMVIQDGELWTAGFWVVVDHADCFFCGARW